MADNKGFLINRSTYKKIKKMSREEMDEYLRELINRVNKENDKLYHSAAKFHSLCMMEALESTKGIGEKIAKSFMENYKRVVNEKTDGNK